MRLRLVKKPFDNPDYVFELKHDGFRAVVYLQDGECKLVSRNSKTLRFGSLQRARRLMGRHTCNKRFTRSHVQPRPKTG
jgi:ATP-dependent DNA ligase